MICEISLPVKYSGRLLGLALSIITMWFAPSVSAQSSDQNYPTPITSNEVSGQIRARDLGDSRVTTYYYLFRGNRGDVFMNVVTNNLNGSIDLFTKTGLRPRTKITFFADAEPTETGRVVYMRESELLLLRIQGRTPNDDPGTFQLKFAGAFTPVRGVSENEVDPVVEGDAGGAVRVNSVGTILPSPKPRATPVEEEGQRPAKRDRRARVEGKIPEDVPIAVADKTVDPDDNVDEARPDADEIESKIPVAESAVSNPARPMEKEATQPPEVEGGEPPVKEITVDIGKSPTKRSALVTITREAEPTAEATLEERLANVLLRVTLRDGTLFARPMDQVLSVNVIRGILTIVTTDGKITEFSILDVAKMTIE